MPSACERGWRGEVQAAWAPHLRRLAAGLERAIGTLPPGAPSTKSPGGVPGALRQPRIASTPDLATLSVLAHGTVLVDRRRGVAVSPAGTGGIARPMIDPDHAASILILVVFTGIIGQS